MTKRMRVYLKVGMGLLTAPSQPLHGLEGQAAARINHDVVDQLGEIFQPCLVIGGKDDIFTPMWMANEVVRNPQLRYSFLRRCRLSPSTSRSLMISISYSRVAERPLMKDYFNQIVGPLSHSSMGARLDPPSLNGRSAGMPTHDFDKK